MPLVPFNELMQRTAQGRYAVGYFESWDMDSMMAVAAAAEALRSPVLLGFSGIYLPNAKGQAHDPIQLYGQMARELCAQLTVPVTLLYNESPYLDDVLHALDCGYGLVMYSDDALLHHELEARIRTVVERAHAQNAAVEGEMTALPGVAGELADVPSDLHLTDPVAARQFVERTGIDALAINIGQVHLHGRMQVTLDLERLKAVRAQVTVPLVLHGATSVQPKALAQAIALGVQKINVGSALKRTYFQALNRACQEVGPEYNPYDIIGSGLEKDVLVRARQALQAHVENWMRLFASDGKAG